MQNAEGLLYGGRGQELRWVRRGQHNYHQINSIKFLLYPEMSRK